MTSISKSLLLAFFGAGLALPAGAAPRAALQGTLPDSLQDALQDALGEVDEPARNSLEARRRAREAAEDVAAVLRSHGYYGFELDVKVTPGPPPLGVVNLEPGPLFKLEPPKIDWVDGAPEESARNAAQAALELDAGAPAQAAGVIAAEGRALAAVQAGGYADARPLPRQAIVDHATTTLRTTYRLAAGQLVRLDRLRVVKPGRTRAGWLQRLAPWSSGERYRPESVAELERRLLDTGVFDTVTVSLAPQEQTTPDGLRPVIVSLADREPRTVELGARYSTSEGPGLDARWTRYNVLGRADTLTVFGRLANIDSRLGAELILPHWRRPQLTLRIGAEAHRSRTDAYDEDGAEVRAGLTRRFGKISYATLGASLEYARTVERQEDTEAPMERRLVAAALLAAASLDHSDDPLDPSRGWRVQGRAQPTVIGGDASLAYLKAEGQVSAYYPVAGKRTVLAGRLRLGSALGAEMPELPASRRFYAGGGGSVRGYGYQEVGPHLPDNTPRGGLSLVESSFEVRQKITERWGAVAFIDAGSIGLDATPGFDELRVGVGVGVRYNLGFGPIRADIAIPLDKRRGDSDFHLYLSVGQSF